MNRSRRLQLSWRAPAIVALLAGTALWTSMAVDAQPSQTSAGAPRVVRFFHHDAIGNALPPLAAAAIDAVPVNEDPKAAALRIASSAIPALVDGRAESMSWAIAGMTVDQDGQSHTRLQQRIAGLRVFGAETIVHLDADNALVGVNGEVLADSNPDALKPTLSFSAAVKAARLHLAAEGPDFHPGTLDHLAVESGELLIFNPAIVDAGASANHVAYHVVLSSETGDQSITAIVDAGSGKLLTTFNNIESAKSRDVRDLGNSTVLPGLPCHTESDALGTATPDCIAAHRFSGDTYDFFQRVFGRDSYDGAGATMLASVRYGTIGNAFWNGRQVAFGPGFATKDVVAHEWTHGLVSSTARLVYLNQSGALNEAVSDIFASMVDVDADWLLGEDLARGAIRSLSDPTLFNQPGKVSDTQYFCGTSDNGGVHVNSGVPNHAAYLMAEGGSYNGRTITAIGGTNTIARDNTAKIFYRALTHYLTSGSGFQDAYEALRGSCADQFGGVNSATCQAVTAALDAVELNQPACGTGFGGAPDTYEGPSGDDTASTATTLTTPQDHNFHDAGDIDWVRFTVAAGASMRFETVGLGTQSDTALRLYATNATTILAEDDDGGGGLASRIDYVFATGGTYFLRVVHFNPAVFGDETGYTLQMTPSTITGDSFEPDNSTDTAKSITPDGPAHVGHNFGADGDVDWVRFTASIGSVYIIETQNLFPQSDTYVFLYAPDGSTLLASDDDGGGRLASRIVWPAPATGTYFLKIRNYNPATFGPNTSYDVRVTTTTTVPDTFEPDNTQTAARVIALNTPQTHDFHTASDFDWVRFATSVGTHYTIETFGLQSRADTVLEIYDGGGNRLAGNDDSAGGLNSVIVYTAPSTGDLFVRVRQFDPRVFGAATGYQLRLSTTTCSGSDAFEPNNTTAQATNYPTTDGTPQSHNHACAGDVDYIRFTAIANMDYDIRTSALGRDADTVLAVLDSSGNVLAFNDDGGGGLASHIRWRAVGAGQYFVQSRHRVAAASGTDTNYQFSITAVGSSADADVHEDDDTQATGKTLTFAAPHTGATSHNFHDAGDNDWVNIGGLTPGAQYSVETFNLGPYADTIVEVYDGSTLLVSNDDGGGGLASRALFNAPASARVTARVIHYSSATFGANTNYDLRVVLAPSASTGDVYEPDNVIGDPTPIALDSMQLHNFHVAADKDWVSFSATSGNTYVIGTSNLGPGADTVLELYRANNTLLAANDDGGGGLASRIVHTADANAPLLVLVRHVNANAGGPDTNYELRVSSTSAGGDSFEPDNISTQASALAIPGTQVGHTFHVPGDVDWVSFDATVGTSYVLQTSNLGAQSDTVLDLFASNATTRLRTNDDDGSSAASRIDWTAPATGTYFVRISHFSSQAAGPTTSYTFGITTVSGCTGNFEPDNAPAQVSTAMIPGATRTGYDFNCQGDVDWVRLTGLNPGTRYAVDTLDLGTQSDTVITLFNETASTPIAENDDYGGTHASHVEFIASARYQLHAPMPNPTMHAPAAAINGVIYVISGNNPALQHFTIVRAFDTRTNTWSLRSDPGVVHTAAAAATDGSFMYLAGGASGTGTLHRRYDPGTDSWTTLAPMPTGRSNAGGVILNGMFHVIGGIVSNRLTTHEAYNIATNTWTTLAPLPAERSDFAVGVIDGRIYVAGGMSNAQGTNTLFRYDPATNQWTTLAPLPAVRAYFSAAVVNGKLFAVGSNGTAEQGRRVYVYDPLTNAWTSAAPLPVGRWAHSVAAIENRVYVMTGVGDNSGTVTDRVDSFIADDNPGTSDMWVRVRSFYPYLTGPTTSYSLRLSTLATASADVHEPDNTAAQARPLTVAAPHTGATSHNFHIAGDEDWVYFDPPAGSTKCYFDTYNLDPVTDTEIWLYDATGSNLLKFDDDGHGYHASLMSYVVTGGVQHKLRLRQHGGSPTGGPGHQYSLRVRCGVDDVFEPDNGPAQATPLPLNTPQRHIISEADDEDWVSFSLTAGTPYIIETINLAAGMDTRLYLYDRDGTTLLAENDDYGTSATSKIGFTPSVSGTYFAYGHHYRDTTFGPDTGYDLNLREGTLSDERPVQVSVASGDDTGRVQLRVRPLDTADALKVEVFLKHELLSFVGAESLIAGKNGETHGIVRLLDSPPHEPIVVGAYLEGKELARGMTGVDALAFNFRLTRPLPGGKTEVIVRATLFTESGEVTVIDVPTVVNSVDGQPRINAINPQSVATETGGTFTVYGSNFVITPKVFLVSSGSVIELRDVRIGLDGTWVEVTVPAGTKIGGFKVRVQNPGGNYADSDDDLYVTRAGTSCDFSLSQERAVVSSAGGMVSVNVTTGEGCVWVPQPGVSWVNSPNSTERTGAGNAQLAVSAVPPGSALGREGVVTIGTRTLVIVQSPNRNPSLSSIGNQTINRGSNTGALTFTVSDDDDDAVQVVGSSSNQTLVPNGNIVLGGGVARAGFDGLYATVNRTVTVTPVATESGATTITLTADDGHGGSATTSFTVTVIAGGVGIPRDVRADVAGSIVDVQWAPPNSGDPVVNYRVEAGRAAGATEVTGTTTNTRLTMNLASRARGRWYIRVIGIAADGRESVPSAEVTADIGAPGPPVNLTRAVNGSIVTLTWSPPESADAESYVIHAGSSPGANNLAIVPVVGTSFTSPPVPDGSYYARVYAVNNFGMSSASNEVLIIVGIEPSLPGPPTSLQATVTDGLVSIAWQPPSGGTAPTGYVLRAGSTSQSSNIAIVPVGAALSLGPVAVPPGVYFVRVHATTSAGEGPPSNEITISVGVDPAPGAPSGLNAIVSGNIVALAWTAPTTGGPVANYVIDAGNASGSSNLAQVAVGNTTSFVASGIPPGVYFVRVRAVNSGGSSGPSNEVRVVVP